MPAAPWCPPAAPGEQRLLLTDLAWQEYQTIGAILADRPALRLTFDQGTLEFMTTSPQHEFFKKLLGRLIEAAAEEFGLPLATAGNMTFQRLDLNRGMEPDDCFWIANESRMRARLDWDPRRDPPPDLVLEIEISRSLVDRMAILAALGVPEVWTFDGQHLRVFLVQPDGTYRQAAQSASFPALPLAGVLPFLTPNPSQDYLSVIRSYRQWLQTVPRPTP
jgi:Uma2 family endonuclease